MKTGRTATNEIKTRRPLPGLNVHRFPRPAFLRQPYIQPEALSMRFIGAHPKGYVRIVTHDRPV
jgi:hypothetical protein